MTELKGATVLITGAGGGFGQEMVRQFAAAGRSSNVRGESASGGPHP